jgi:glyoxylase-like metal-dependent hydrolase (beta-lactamase superfamily II)
LKQHLQDKKAQLKHILLTHGHPDHVAGVSQTIQQWPSASLHLHPLEEENYSTAQELAMHFGMPLSGDLPPPTHELADGEILKIGQTIELTVVHTPGHAPGHVAFVDSRPMPSPQQLVDGDDENNEGAVLISGDLLFRGSVGRTDLHNASVEDLFASLRRLYELFDDESIVLSGHTTPTYLKRERTTNPFVDLALKRPIEWYEEAKGRIGWKM